MTISKRRFPGLSKARSAVLVLALGIFLTEAHAARKPKVPFVEGDKLGEKIKTELNIGPLGIKGNSYSKYHTLDVKFVTGDDRQWTVDIRDADQAVYLNCINVVTVEEGSPADGHLKRGDVILSMEGVPLKSSKELDSNLRLDLQRKLQMHVGDLLDKAEGRGEVTFQVIEFEKMKELLAKESESPVYITKEEVPRVIGSKMEVIKIELNQSDAYLRLVYDAPVSKSKEDPPRLAWSNMQFLTGEGRVVPATELKPITLDGKTKVLFGGSETSSDYTLGADARVVGRENFILQSEGYVEYKIPKDAVAFYTEVELAKGSSADPLVGATVSTRPEVHPLYDELITQSKRVSFKIPKIGSFGEGEMYQSKKMQAIIDLHCKYLLKTQNADGSWDRWNNRWTKAYFDTSIAALALMSTGDPKYDEAVKKAAYYVAETSGSDSWGAVLTTTALFMAEYYLKTGDQNPIILNGLAKEIKSIEAGRSYDFSLGHHPTFPGYNEARGMNIGTAQLAAALAVMELTDRDLNGGVVNRVLEYIGSASRAGSLPYGRSTLDLTPEIYLKRRRDLGSSARTSAALVGTIIGGGSERFYVNCSRLLKNSIGGADLAHAAPSMGQLWAAIAYALVDESWYRENLNSMAWNSVLTRRWDGGIIRSGYYLNSDKGETPLGMTYQAATEVISLCAGRKNLAVTGQLSDRHTEMYQNDQVIHFYYYVYRKMLDQWNLAYVALGENAPASMAGRLEKLKDLPRAGLYENLLDFIEADGFALAGEIAGISGIGDDEKADAIELLLGLRSYATATAREFLVGVESLIPDLEIDGEITVGGKGGATYAMSGQDLLIEDRGRWDYEQFRAWKKMGKGSGLPSAEQLEAGISFRYTVNGVPVSLTLSQGGEHIYPAEGLILQPEGVEKQVRLDNGHVITGFVEGNTKVVKEQSFKLGERISFGYAPDSAHTASLHDLKRVADAPGGFKLREGELMWRKEDLKLPMK